MERASRAHVKLGAAGVAHTRLVAVLIIAAFAVAGKADGARADTLRPVADAGAGQHGAKRGLATGKVLRVGGRGRWRSYVRFGDLPAGAKVTRAVLRLSPRGALPSALTVWTAHDRGTTERALARKGIRATGTVIARWKRPAACRRRSRSAACRRISIDVTAAARPGRSLALVLGSRARRTARFASHEAGRRGSPVLIVQVAPAAAPAPAPAPIAAPAPPRPASGPVAVAGLWTTAAELAARPTSGSAWAAVKAAADGSPGTASIADQNSDHDIDTLAAALVYARTKIAAYRAKAAAGIGAAIGTEQGGRTLALGRNLASYVIAADLIELGNYDGALDGRFRSWLSAVRTEDLGGDTLVSTSEQRPNNWGTMAGASRVAADIYLGDTADLDRAATVFRGWLGDRSAYSGFKFGDMSWQVDPSHPVGVQPPGATKDGLDIDGALADDMRRGCALQTPPCPPTTRGRGCRASSSRRGCCRAAATTRSGGRATPCCARWTSCAGSTRPTATGGRRPTTPGSRGSSTARTARRCPSSRRRHPARSWPGRTGRWG